MHVSGVALQQAGRQGEKGAFIYMVENVQEERQWRRMNSWEQRRHKYVDVKDLFDCYSDYAQCYTTVICKHCCISIYKTPKPILSLALEEHLVKKIGKAPTQCPSSRLVSEGDVERKRLYAMLICLCSA